MRRLSARGRSGQAKDGAGARVVASRENFGIGGLGGELRRVLITRVVENTYFAELLIHRGDEVFSVDARPSDSIAIALRAGAAIFTSDELLDDTPIEIVDTEFEPEEGESPPEDGLRAEELKDYLRRLNPEDFGRFRP